MTKEEAAAMFSGKPAAPKNPEDGVVEREVHGYVVDMIYVEIINFPVFNIADSFITVGFALMIFSMIFVYKEKDFDLLFGKKKAEEKIEEKAEEKTEE